MIIYRGEFMKKIKSITRENSRLVNFFIEHFEDDEYMAALDLTTNLMLKNAEEGFMAGFRKGKGTHWSLKKVASMFV